MWATETVASGRTALIETFATSLAQVLRHDPRVGATTVALAKPAALDDGVTSVTADLEQAS